MNLYIDYGGTNFRYQFNEGEIFSLQTKEVNLKEFLDEIVSKNKISFIGISFAGQVKEGVIISAPNIDIKNFDVKNYVKEKYNINLEIQNDLTCASLAEKSVRASKVLLLLYIGTGFGSGVVIDNRAFLGANYLALEIGHIPFKKTPFMCGCGRDDCMELSCSGNAIKLWSKEYNLKASTLDELLKINSKESNFIYNNFLEALSKSFHTILNLFDADTIVLGGSVAVNNRFLVEFLKNEFKKSAFRDIRRELKIELSSFKNGCLEGAKRLKN